jgi:MarR family transcriptional regulator, organic hydroperoxide resistance regulator
MSPSSDSAASGREMKPDVLAKQLFEILRLIHSVNAALVDDALMMLNESGLTPPQLIALYVLKLEGAHSVGEIADRTRLSRPATSHLVDRLVVMGLVDRAEDENDRRQKQVSISPKGSDFIERLSRARIGDMAAGLKMLSPKTRTRLCEALEEVSRELMEHTPERNGSEEVGR